MNRTLVIPAVLLLAAWAAAQTTPAQMKNPVSTALRDILPGRRKTPSHPSRPCPPRNSTTNPPPTR